MIESLPTTGVPIRVLSRRSYIVDRPVTIQVARSEGAMRQELRELSLILIFGLPVGVVIAGLGGYALARRALAPIEQMTERARTITAERLSDRLPVAHPENEMGRLASVFNETLGRLEGSFDQMRHFTADVSHELRTPLTAIRSVGEVGLRGHRNEASYRSIIGSMLEEVDRLSQLVDRLLALSRAGTQQPPFALDTVDFAALADDVVSHLGVLAEEKGQTLAIEKIASPRVRADRLVLRQALINLVDNAIKFTPQSGRVRIRLSETPFAGRRGRHRQRTGRTTPRARAHLRPLLPHRWERSGGHRARPVAGPGRRRGHRRTAHARADRPGRQHVSHYHPQPRPNPDEHFRQSSDDSERPDSLGS